MRSGGVVMTVFQRRRSAINARRRLGAAALAWTAACTMFFPIFWMALTAFKTEVDALQSPPKLLFTPTLDAFREINGRVHIFGAFYNSVVDSFEGTLVCLVFALPAAYALAFYPSRRTKHILLGMLCTKMVPPMTIMIPIYLIIKAMGLLDTQVSIVIINSLLNMPVVIWMLFSFFREVPKEVLESSRMDGATPLQDLRLLLLPLALPGIMSTVLLSVILCWNESFWSIVLTSSEGAPLTAVVATFSSSEGLIWPMLSAVSLIAVAPMLILGWITQRHVVRGLTLGAVK